MKHKENYSLDLSSAYSGFIIFRTKKQDFRQILFRLIIFMSIIFTASPVLSNILMPPYLQAVTKNSVIIMVETDSKADAAASYGLDTRFGKEQKTTAIKETDAKTFIHRIKLEKLEPGTTYHYMVTHGGTSSSAFSFTTAVEESTPYRFAIMGDCRSNAKIHSQIAGLIKNHNPAFSVYNGDLCFNSKYSTWKSEFFTIEELMLDAYVPFFNTAGNHEKLTQNTYAFTESPASASGQQAYYSFDYGDIHFLVLSTETQCKEGSAQYKFAQNDLKNTEKKFKVVVFHESAYCSGGHGDNKTFRKLSEQVLEKAGVDLVITGHSHFYQHNHVRGIHHLTIAGGGAPLYTPKENEFTVRSAKEYHYGIADYKPGTLTITVYSLKNEVIDKIVINK